MPAIPEDLRREIEAALAESDSLDEKTKKQIDELDTKLREMLKKLEEDK